jgi:hypothetical protein
MRESRRSGARSRSRPIGLRRTTQAPVVEGFFFRTVVLVSLYAVLPGRSGTLRMQ